MIIPSFYPVVGGAQSQIRRIATTLIAHNWPVCVLTRQHCYAHPQGLPANDAVDRIPITRLYSRGYSKTGALLYVVGGLWYLLRHGRRDVYHAHDIGSSGWLAVAARYLLGGRCIIKLRTGCYSYERRCATGVARWQFRTLLRLADRIVVVNSEVENLMSDLKIPAERVVLVPNCIDTRQFCAASPEQKLAVRRQLGLPPDTSIVLYVGRLSPPKGVDVLLRAWARLPTETRSGAKLVLVGDGSERDTLLGMTASLGIEQSVLFAGEQQNVRDYYWASDVFALPSRTEGLSNALLEAMACELPVIVSNVGGSLDIIAHNENGVFFETEDDLDLAHKLADLLIARNSWGSMGTKARKRAIEYADMTDVVDRLRGVYCDLFRHEAATPVPTVAPLPDRNSHQD